MSYDMIDRFLRNNLHDEGYAEFSAALDAVIADAAAAHAQGLRERIAELERDNANLKTVMVAAAEEIHAHWDAHCDAEGYGPQNLMRRLEEGIPSEYGYTAGAFAAQQKRIAELENEAREQALQALASEGQWMEQTGAQQKRIAELEAQRQWQPIETAPRDGRKVVLFYLNRNNFRRTVMARWVTDEQAAEIDADDVGLESGWYECIDNCDDYCQVCIHEGEPTHWMPLPPPPVERAHGIEGGETHNARLSGDQQP